MASIRRRHNRESFRAWHERKVGEREQRERQMDYGWFLFSCVLSVHYFSQRLLAQDDASRRCQAPATRQSWTEDAASKNVVVHVPQRCLTRACVIKQVIGLTVSIEIGSSDQLIATRNGRPKATSGECNPRQIPDRKLTRARIEE